MHFPIKARIFLKQRLYSIDIHIKNEAPPAHYGQRVPVFSVDIPFSSPLQHLAFKHDAIGYRLQKCCVLLRDLVCRKLCGTFAEQRSKEHANG